MARFQRCSLFLSRIPERGVAEFFLKIGVLVKIVVADRIRLECACNKPG